MDGSNRIHEAIWPAAGSLIVALLLLWLPPPAEARFGLGADAASATPAHFEPLKRQSRRAQRRARRRARHDLDRDGLPNRTEIRRTRTNPRRRDTDRDRLIDGVEVKRTRTNPRRRDTDRDRLRDWFELRRSKTNPRRADTDGDGARDRWELIAGSNPRDPASVPWPVPPPPTPTPIPPPVDPPTPEPDDEGEETPDPPSPPTDTTPPQTTIDSGPPALTNDADAEIAFSGTDAGGSGVASFRCRLDSEDAEDWATCSSPRQYEGLTDGAHIFEVRVIDDAGNVDQSPASHEWTVDTVPPTLSIDSDPDGLTNDPSPTFTFGSESGAVFQCSIDQGEAAFGSCSGAGSHTPGSPLADGEYTFRVRATDAVGNQATATRDFQVDTAAPPAPQLESTEPASPANENKPLIQGNAPAGTTVDLHTGPDCNGEAIATVTPAELESGVEASVADDSTTAFRATATTAAENTSGCSEALVYVEDSTSPQTQIDTGPATLVNSPSAEFSFSGDDGSGSGVTSFECRLDSADPESWETCSSPRELSELADGAHLFEARAIDDAGNVDGSPTSHEWEVDTVPPSLSIDSGPDGLTNDPSPTFGFSSEPGATFQCSIDEGAPDFNPCSDTEAHTPAEPLGDGPHTFRVRAVDAAGNQATATRDFEVDATAPQTTIDSGPPALTNDPDAEIVFSGTDPGGSGVASFQCRLDSEDAEDWAPCSSPEQYEALGDGAHAFEVRAIDKAGNVDQSPASHGWEVDTSPPSLSIDSGPDGLTNNPSPLFGFSSEPGATFQCSIDEGAPDFGPCSDTEAHTPAEPLADGPHTFRVRAVDAAGNQATATRNFEVDTAAPPAPVLESTEPASPANGNEPLVIGSAQAETTVRLYVGGNCEGAPSKTVSAAELEAGVDVTVTDDSTTAFRATATTVAENTSGCSEALVYVEDSTKPQTQIDSGPPALTNDADAEIGFSGSDPEGSGVASFDCKLDSGGFETCATGIEYTGLGEGAHSFEVRAIDDAGNIDQSPASHEWEVDTVPPPLSIDSGPDGLTNNPSPTFSFSSEPGATFQCSIDGGTPDFGPCSGAGSHTPDEPLEDGEYTFRVRATDTAGNQATATREFEVDTSAPQAPVLEATEPSSPADENKPLMIGSALPGTTVRLYTGPDCEGAEIATVTPAELQSGVQVTVAEDSTTAFRATATTAAENTSGCSEALLYVEDSTSPQTQIDTAPAALVNSAKATFGFSGSDPEGSGIASFQCKLDGGGFEACATGVEYAGLGEGAHSFEVRAIDNAGNVDGSPTSHEWSVDTLAPTTQIDAKPASLIDTDEATFAFSGADAGGSGLASFQCSLDEAPFSACSSGIELTGLSEGDHTFEVRAIDNAGNIDGSPASHGWTVDTTPPSLSIDSGPDGLTNDPSPTFAFNSEPGAMFQCSIDEGAADFGACSEPESHGPAEPLEDGAHVFRVRATDAAGNQATATRDFEVDATPPETTIDSGPPALTNDPDAEIVFSGTDPGGSGVASFQCRLDSEDAEAWAPCSSPRELSELADGAHVFEVRAIDDAGNIDQSPASHEWEVDTTPPAVSVDSGPDGLTNDPSPTFSFSSEPGATFQCSIDAGTPNFGPCSDTEAHTPAEPLGDEPHTFRVRAADAAGNQAPATRNFEVDATAPETTIDSGPPALTNDPDAEIVFSGTDPGGSGVASFQCRLDSEDAEAWAPCSSPRELSELADGAHVFEVRAIDDAGNIDQSPASHGWEVDTVPPPLSIDSGPDGLTNDPSPTFGFSSEPGATFQCSIDEGVSDFGPCSGAESHGPTGPLADGLHTFRVRATDAAGNQATATRDFEVDTAAPPAPELESTEPPSPANENDPLVIGSAQAETTVRLYVGGNCEGAPSKTVSAAELEAGVDVTVTDDSTTAFRATATTVAENTSGCSEALVYVEDSTSPQTQIDSGPPALVNTAKATFQFSGADTEGSGIASFECKLDGGGFETCATGIEYTGLAEGAHTFEARAIDDAGNIDGSPASHEWTVDATPPSVSIDSGPDGLTNDPSPTFGFSSEPGASFQCSIDEGAPDFGPCSDTEAHTPAEPLGDEPHTFRVRATDAAGNQATATRNFEVDATAPETTIDSGPPALTNDPDAEIAFSGSDPGGSGVASFQCSVDEAPFSACSTGLELTELAEGAHSFEVHAIDDAGNVDGSPASHEWEVDTVPPSLSIDSGPDGLTNNPSPTFSFSSEPGATFQCSIDQGAPDFGACSEPESHTPTEPLADGPHTFRVRAVDAAGNQATATRDFQVDTAAPPAPVLESTQPPSPANENEPLVIGSALPGTTVRLYTGPDCDGSAFATVTPAELENGVEAPVEDDSTTAFRATATTVAENTSGCAEALVYIEDSTSPQTQIDTAPAALVNTAKATFQFSGTDTEGSGIASFECKLDSGSFEACATGIEYTGLAEGAHTFEARAIDDAGNIDGSPASHEWTVDATPPSVSIDSGSDGLTNDPSPTFGFSSEPGATFQCSIDAGSPDFGPCSDTESHTPAEPLGDGPHTFRVRAVDAAGNQATATRDFEVDATAPQTTIDSGPPALTNDPDAEIVFSGTDPGGSGVASFQCRLDSEDAEDWAPCSSPEQYEALGDGAHAFEVRAIDKAGNVDGSPASHKWEVDTVPPDLSIDSGPDGLTNNPSPLFGFSSEPGATFACSIDEGAPDFGSCSGPESHGPAEPLADGEYTFRVRATDAAGNQATATRDFQVDTAAPPAPVLESTEPASPANENDPLVIGSAQAETTVRLYVGGNCEGSPSKTVSAAELEAGVDVTVTDDSTTAFRATATTVAENTSGCSEALVYIEDSTSPQTQIDTAPAALVNTAKATFQFSGADPEGSGIASFECKLDGGGFEACATGIEYTGLAEGAHSFEVRAIDKAGNVDQSPASHEWTVDTTPPSVSVDSGPDGLTNNPSPLFGFSSEPGATFACSIDQGAPDFGACSGPESHGPAEPLGDSLHTFRVRVTDAAGNQATATRDFAIDSTAPQTTVASGPPALTNDPDAEFELSGTDPGGSGVASFQCRLDSEDAEDWAPCSSPEQYEALGDGPHAFEVRAIDKAGNVDQSPASHEWEVDTTPPSVSVDSGPDGLTNDPSPTFGFSSEPGATFACSIDQGTPDFGPCSGPESHGPAEPLGDGLHTFRVRVTDAAGNQATATRDFAIDSTAPQTTVDSGPPALTNDPDAEFEFSGSDPGGSGLASFQCRLDSEDAEDWAPCSSPEEYEALSDGSHAFEARVIDKAGNVDGSPASHGWTVDTTPPQVTIDSLSRVLFKAGDTGELTWHADENGDFELRVGGGDCDAGSAIESGAYGSQPDAQISTVEAAQLAEGVNVLRLCLTDGAGNRGQATAPAYKDTGHPETQIDAQPDVATQSTTATFAFSGSDPGGFGVSHFECRLDAGPWTSCASPREYAELAEGPHEFEVRAVDFFGNADLSPAGFNWSVDNTPPEVQIESGPEGPTGDSTPAFTFSSEPGAAFQCSIDQGDASFGPCSGPGSHAPESPLADGAYSFRVRAADAAGNQAVATRDFEVTTEAPPAPVLSGTEPSWPANDNELLVLGSAQPGTTVRLYTGLSCEGSLLATVGAAALEAGIEVSVADNSITVFTATATTAAGSTSGCSGFTFYVEDSTAPETQIDSGPAAVVDSDEAVFEFSGTDPGFLGSVASFQCRLDGGGFSTCASGIELSGLADGPHSFEVRAIDGAGNIDQTPAGYAWTIAATAPQVTIDSLSQALLKEGETSQVTWHADENGDFELRVGGDDCESGSVIESGAYSSQPATQVSDVTAKQLAEGVNTLRLCLTDGAGDSGEATTTVEKDTGRPVTQIDAGPAAFTQSHTAAFAFSGSDPGGSGVAAFECRLDSESWVVCASPREYAELPEGPHEFEVRAIDNAGNPDLIPASINWTVDNTPPGVQIDSGPDGLTSNPSPTFGFSSEPGATFECSIDEGEATFDACSDSGAHTPAEALADGPHSFRVRASDPAGNQASATRGFEVDTTAPPEPTLSETTPASPANENEPRLSGSALAGSTVQLYTGGACSGSPVATLSPAELGAGIVLTVPDDTTTVFRASIETAERTSGCSEPLTYVEDSRSPETTIASAPPATTYSTSASFFLTVDEPATSLECSLDGAAFAACESPRSYTDLSAGEHSFSVRATDAAGNLEIAPTERAWTIEAPPTAPSACAGGNAEATTAPAVRAAVQAGEDVCVTADVGDVDLGDLGSRPVVVSTAPGGSVEDVDLGSTTDLTIGQARLQAVELRQSHRTRLLGNTIGGSEAEPALDQAIFMPDDNDDVLIEGNDIGWMIADESGNTGYGCRCYGNLDRLRFVGNRLHDLGADGFQGVGGVDVTIDRNEIGPVGRNPGSDEHSDNIQITGNEANLRITNNWIHHQGYYAGEVTANAGSTYIHGGSTGSLTFENNLIETAQGRTEICGLGSGGSERSNLTVSGNTWVEGGLAFAGFPGFEWDCDAGTGNTITRNIAVDPDGGLANHGYPGAIVEPNLFGGPALVTFDAAGNCTSANCNPPGDDPIGYRKPAGVSW